jgi:thiamine-monophosphate kinase
MRERELVSVIQRICASRAPGLVAGIGDDCAIVRPRAGEELLVTTDFLIEGVHFERATHTSGDCGWKALARGLSDIAAMGGVPRYAFVSLALAAGCDARWVRGFYRGMNALAGRHGVAIAGGDLTRNKQIVCDIVVLGGVARGKALRRNTARVGDSVYVTGALGTSALGLATQRGAAWRRHRRPEPRIAQGRLLRAIGARACMDLSDGLALDLQRLCAASGCAAELSGALPVYRGATREQALGGGEDYELLFTAPPRARVPQSLAGIAVTRIGRCVAGTPGSVQLAGGERVSGGWDPFRRDDF